MSVFHQLIALSLSLSLSSSLSLSPPLSAMLLQGEISLYMMLLHSLPCFPSCGVPSPSHCHIVPHTSPPLPFSGEALRNRQHLGCCLRSWQNSSARSVRAKGF